MTGMLDALLAALAAITSAELALVAGVALFASVVGGVAGYGTGALMPLVLVPMLGPEPVVPIIAHLGAVHQHRPRARVPCADRLAARCAGRCAGAMPTCMLSAYGYTLLTGKGAAIVIGAMLMLTRAAALLCVKRCVMALGDTRAGAGCGGLWRGGRRHRRRRRDPAVDPDGGGPAGRGGDRDRCRDLDVVIGVRS